jgi:hypothetical protein
MNLSQQRPSIRFRNIEEKTPVLVDFLTTRSLLPILTVRCRPRPNCEAKRCFINVENQVAKEGGKMITGWIFNEFENLMIASEAHAVWEHPNGKKIDITPHQFQPQRIIFVPDPKVAIKRGYTAPFQLILSTKPEDVAIIRFGAAVEHIKEQRFEGFGKEIEVTKTEIQKLAAIYNVPFDVATAIMMDIMS